MGESRTARWLDVALLCAIVLLCAARFWHIDADPPPGLTWSAALYTDEGYYSSSSFTWARTGHWYRPGDYNPAVGVPVWSLMMAAAMGLFGATLPVSRGLAALLFCGLVAGIYWLVRQQSSKRAALVSALCAAALFRVFAYSRLALGDLPMTTFAVVSLASSISASRRDSLAIQVLSALAALCGILTKGTCALVVPVVVLALWFERRSTRRALLHATVWLGTLVVCYLIYNCLAQAYKADLQLLRQGMVVERLIPEFSPLVLAKRARALIAAVVRALDIRFSVSTGLVCLVLLVDQHWRREKLVWLSLVWGLALVLPYMATTYAPPRYYLPLVVPHAVLAGLIAGDLRTHSWTRYIRLGYVLFLAVILGLNCKRIVYYLERPEYTLVQAAQSIGNLAHTQTAEPLLLGTTADTISLISGIPSVGDDYGAWSLEQKLKHLQPTHYVVVGPVNSARAETIAAHYRMELIASYSVLHDYWKDAPMDLYRLVPLAQESP